MALVFNMTVEELEHDLVQLIGQRDRISARIDSYEKVNGSGIPEYTLTLFR